MNYNAFLEVKLKEKKINKKELHKLMKDYFVQEEIGRDGWLEYNTLANKMLSNNLSASELLVMSALLDIDMNQLVEPIRNKMESLEIIDKKLANADNDRIEFMRYQSNIGLECAYYNCKQIAENIFEFISYNNSINKIAIEHFDFNKNICKTVSVLNENELEKHFTPSDYINEYPDYNLFLDEQIKKTMIELKRVYYLLYPEEKSFTITYEDWCNIKINNDIYDIDSEDLPF